MIVSLDTVSIPHVTARTGSRPSCWAGAVQDRHHHDPRRLPRPVERAGAARPRAQARTPGAQPRPGARLVLRLPDDDPAPARPGLQAWRKRMFVAMARNANSPIDHFQLPIERTAMTGSRSRSDPPAPRAGFRENPDWTFCVSRGTMGAERIGPPATGGSMSSDYILSYGTHARPEDGRCAMEWVSHLAGESHSDEPACVSPVLRAMCIALNDGLEHEPRQRLRPYLARTIGTVGDGTGYRARLDGDGLAGPGVHAGVAEAAGLTGHRRRAVRAGTGRRRRVAARRARRPRRGAARGPHGPGPHVRRPPPDRLGGVGGGGSGRPRGGMGVRRGGRMGGGEGVDRRRRGRPCPGGHPGHRRRRGGDRGAPVAAGSPPRRRPRARPAPCWRRRWTG